ncbi:hypothetical protein BGZ93_001180 [Podila epicladia]|nr:hypothetical protein BGZ92_001509 [Podila epicladia]KAG0098090.1 hypothetical protein BGZ93_001180 [Podila epicladia]
MMMSHDDSEHQQLPNECLYLIVDHLRDDLATLRALLLANRFFFHAAVPLMLNDPLSTWEMTYSRPEFKTDKEKLSVLLIASIIHAQRARAQSLGQDFTADGFLSKFGFQLVEPVTSLLLQDAMQGVSPTIIDYSKYFTNLFSYLWRYVEFQTVMRLKEFPQTWKHAMPTRNLHGNLVQYLPYAEQEHIEELQLHNDYKDNVQERLIDLVLYHNTEFITSLHFHVALSHRYLPYADKLQKLQIVHLDRDESMPDSHLQDMISFIVQNHTAFPGKPPLRLEFGYSWHGPQWETMTPELRQRQHIFQKPRVALYAAVRNPPALDISMCPGFYENCENICAESLEELDDQDMERMIYEGPERRTFLKRCHQLRLLQLAVSRSDLFSWVVEKQLDGSTRSRDKKVLRNLKTLTMWSDRGSNSLLPALNDAMIAFAHSLVEVTAQGHFSYENARAAFPQERLRKDPVLGQWNLPFIRTIDIDIHGIPHLHINGFDKCPQLETLYLKIAGHRTPSALPRGDAPNIVVLSNVWKLPRLKSLFLNDMAALTFNYDSLNHMQNLQELRMVVNKKCSVVYPVDTIPRLSSYICRKETSHYNISVSEHADQKWKDSWNLPKLRSLFLEGPPSSVFSFNWLCGCPSLSYVELVHQKGLQRLPISSLSPYSNVISEVSSTKTPSDSDDTSLDPDIKPLLESKLHCLILKGPWAVSELDLITALTVYMPNLSSLQLDRINNHLTLHGDRFVETILEAKALGRAMTEDTSSSAIERGITNTDSSPERSSASVVVPVGKLHDITSRYCLSKQMCKSLCLLSLKTEEEAKSYRKAGITVFTISDKLLILNPERRAREGLPV